MEQHAVKIIEGFEPQGGKHCVTNALKQIFNYYSHPLSEEMLLGLGEGLDFAYIGLADAPMITGRVNVMAFEQALAQRLGIKMKIRKSPDNQAVFQLAKKCIDQGHPVYIYVDMPFLPYLQMEQSGHFGGHAIVLFGYDDNEEYFYVSDRDNSDYPINTPKGPIQQDFHKVSYKRMELARGSAFRPFPVNNKYGEFDFSHFDGVTKEMLSTAIAHVCEKMLNPPAGLKGIRGIEKFSREILRWRRFELEKLKLSGITNYFFIHKDGGTGGGLFRNMYGLFLIEASHILDKSEVTRTGEAFVHLSADWDHLAQDLWALGETGGTHLLEPMHTQILSLLKSETQLFNRLQKAMA